MSTLIIVGSSVRAAAMSALRAGFSPWCIDLFRDSDLQRLTPNAYRCPTGEWPNGIVSIFKEAPHAPWVYTGGLENHPNLIRELSELRPLWGNGPNVLLKSRSPFHVWKLLHEADLPRLEVRDADAELPGYCKWLRKPYCGSGGNGIRFTTEPLPEAEACERKVYHQQFVEGEPYSSVYIGDGVESAKLLGSTRQLIGEGQLNAAGFQYCGNVGPVELSGEVNSLLRRTGDVLVEGCKLKGLFGVDWVLAQGVPWLIEVNPRYPASVEVLEIATGQLAMNAHACRFSPDIKPHTRTGGSLLVGKAIYYAPHQFTMPVVDLYPTASQDRHNIIPALADVPEVGELIAAGWPVLTLLTSAPTVMGCTQYLLKMANRIRHNLGIRRGRLT